MAAELSELSGDVAGLFEYRLRDGKLIAVDHSKPLGEPYSAITCSIRGIDPELLRRLGAEVRQELGIPLIHVYEPTSWWQSHSAEQKSALICCAVIAALWLIATVVYLVLS